MKDRLVTATDGSPAGVWAKPSACSATSGSVRVDGKAAGSRRPLGSFSRSLSGGRGLQGGVGLLKPLGGLQARVGVLKPLGGLQARVGVLKPLSAACREE